MVAVIVAIAGALRSTWSPCGLSMLSTITPIGERGRGRRYGVTAAWFIAGSALGGLCLGACIALLSAGIGALHLSPMTLAAVSAVCCLLAAALDAGMGGIALPVHHRQVNERWLDQFRPWVYGMGFGWQIGTGLATYIMTAAVYLLIAVAALTANPAVALIVGVVFGSVRGLAVLLGRGIEGPDSLRTFHRRFAALGPASRWVVVVVEIIAALSIAASAWWPAAFALGAAVVAVTVGLIARGSPALSPARTAPSRSRALDN
jgi:hypothetical protein